MQLDPNRPRQQGDESALRKAVADCIARARPGGVGVAVSGGGDSMALLHLCARVSARTGDPVEAVTVDHGLREGSREEAEMVASVCAGLGIPHEILTWQGWDGAGNLQAAARAARYGLIADWARSRGIGCVALGHTGDDLAETFLMRLSRRSGLDGLAAMATRFDRDGTSWARPLLHQSRAGLRAYLTRQGLDWAEDPANDDTRFDRTRARQIMAALAPLGIDAEGLAHTAQALAQARAALDHCTAAAARERVTADRGDLILDLCPPLPDEIERRLLNAMLQWVGGADYPPRWTALAGVTAQARAQGRQTLAGCVLSADGETLRVTREHAAVRDCVAPTQAIWDRRWRIDGPHSDSLEIRALGAAVTACPDWRESGLPRASLAASPAIWQGDTLVAAPLAGLNRRWTARIVAPFTTTPLCH